MTASWQESDDKPRLCWKAETHSSDKGPYSQGYGLPSGHGWLWELGHKGAKHQRIDAFQLWYWRRLLRVGTGEDSWESSAKTLSQSILDETNPEYSLGGLMLKLKFQCFGHLMRIANSSEKSLMLGKMKAEGEGCQRCSPQGHKESHNWVTEQQQQKVLSLCSKEEN